MLTQAAPVPHANRGHTLELMILRSCAIYEQRGIACVQKLAVPAGRRADGTFFRAKSTVDFMGVVRGVAVAFDAKHLKAGLAKYSSDARYEHQLEALAAFEQAGGVAALLVEFTGRAIFMAARYWLAPLLRERASIRLEAFDAAAVTGAGVFEIEPLIGGVPIPFAPAVAALHEARPVR